MTEEELKEAALVAGHLCLEDWEHSAKVVESLVAEVRRLREALPVTADGVPVVPEMEVWVLAEPLEKGVVRSVSAKGFEVERPTSIVWHDGSKCYSSESAARAAKESHAKS